MTLKLRNISDITSEYDVLLFDLWGVIIEGAKTYDGVVDAINAVSKHKKIFFVTNAPRPAYKMKNTMLGWGMNVTEDMIISSGDLARNIILNSTLTDKPKILHLGEDRNQDILDSIDHVVTIDPQEADIILLSLYRDEGEDLSEFDSLLEQIAKQQKITICANPDTIIPNLGRNRYCSGYFAEKIEKMGGSVIYTGKPKPRIYQEAFRKIGNCDKNRILMIGDTLDTDIKGALESGIDAALVLTGNARQHHANFHSIEEKLVALDRYASHVNIKPNFILNLV